MTIYDVTKYNLHTEEVIRYGTMCEEDMKLVTRGYKQHPGDKEIYMRKGSNWYYAVKVAR